MGAARLPALVAPKGDLAARLAAAEREELTVEGLRIQNADLSGTRFFGLRLRGVLFENCRLTDCRWERADCADTVFRRCDLSGSDWRDSFFERVDIEGSKAVGAGFAETGWRQARLMDCALSYAAFDRASLRQTAFSACDLSFAALPECIWKAVTFAETNLRHVNFFHTPLAGVDLTTCELDGVILSESSAELRGAVVSPFQAVGFAKRLGLTVKEG